MNTDDIRAFGPAPAAGATPGRRRRLWPWLLGALLVLALLVAAAGAALWAVADSAPHGLHVIVNGQAGDGWDGWDAWDSWDGDFSLRHGLGGVLGLLLAAVVVLLVVPFTLLLGLLLGLVGLATGLTVAVGALGTVAAVLLSPLWGLGLLLWLLLRRRSPAAARMAA
jgi:hypothetical protein